MHFGTVLLYTFTHNDAVLFSLPFASTATIIIARKEY